MNNIFQTTIKDLISRNKFFQCFVCYEQFNSQNRYPMEVCLNHHYMCEECVKSRAFQCKAKNHYKCGLCLVPIKITEIRKNSFILSIKEFFENLIDRQEKSRQRYKEYMDNQEKIVQILIQQNQLVVNQSEKKDKEIDKLEKKVKNLEFKLHQQEKKYKPKDINKQILQKEKPKHHNPQQSDQNNQQFENMLAWKDNDVAVPAHNLFKSNIFKSSVKPSAIEQNSQFILHPAYSNIYSPKFHHHNITSQSILKPQSRLSKLIQQGKQIKENLIKQEHQSQVKLKESLKELQAHSKYNDLLDQQISGLHKNEEQEDMFQSIKKDTLHLDDNNGQPRKKVHVDQNQDDQNAPGNSLIEQKQARKYPSWFFIYERN